MSKIITLTTDFGTKDGYAGAVKGVIFSINPQAQIVDISHQVPAGNILAGAFCLLNAAPFYPQGTIHVAVIDPGVGSSRRPILVQTERRYYVGPDNGVFDLVLEKDHKRSYFHLTNTEYFLGRVSATFHARDIFAPVAAYLSLGVKPDEFGSRIAKTSRLKLPTVKKSGHKLEGRIIHIDNFGNLVSNVTRRDLGVKKQITIKIKGRLVPAISRTFSEVWPEELVGYIGSGGFLEIGVNLGNASHVLKANVGDKVGILL